MNNIYLINETVLFIAAQHRLEPVGEQGAATTLNVPVSRCLLLLLQNMGEVVSQKDFVYEVWESKGQFANTNTYFQSIHLLRKALKIAGIKDAVIKTIPKEGLKFVGRLTLLEENNSDSLTGWNLAMHTIAPTTSLPPTFVEVESQSSSPPRKCAAQQNRAYLEKMAIVGLLALMLFSAFITCNDINKDENFFENYVAIGNVNQCAIYSNKNFVLRASKEYVDFFVKKNVICSPGQVAYIAINPDATRVIIHVCDKSINNTASCLTKVYMERKYEN
jgi:DNA-binding winged helix-turn-helix (wHTH) protein